MKAVFAMMMAVAISASSEPVIYMEPERPAGRYVVAEVVPDDGSETVGVLVAHISAPTDSVTLGWLEGEAWYSWMISPPDYQPCGRHTWIWEQYDLGVYTPGGKINLPMLDGTWTYRIYAEFLSEPGHYVFIERKMTND